jgi:ABC-type nitrate/sulfonate/bicarbonate transport system ATPase subunit
MGLKLKNITKKFETRIIFEDFSFDFSDTGIYALVGESGVVKTTLLKIIAGLDTDYKGTVTGGGLKNTAFAFQEYRLFPQLTALENVVVPNSNQKDQLLIHEAKEMLYNFGFTESELSLRPSELSGGMKQRISIIRAFMKKSPILLLDEPTKELDENIRKTLYSQLLQESQKRLVILVSHQKEDLDKIDAIPIFI